MAKEKQLLLNTFSVSECICEKCICICDKFHISGNKQHPSHIPLWCDKYTPSAIYFFNSLS